MKSAAAYLLKSLVAGAVMSAAALPTHADELEWYQQALTVAEPDQLGFYSHVSDECPVDAESIDATIEGVFIRSRIKPIADDYSAAEQMFVEINVYCTELSGSSNEVIFETDVRFGFLLNNTDMVLNWDYGTLDQGTGGDIRSTVRRDTEDAIADFLRANLPGAADNSELEGNTHSSAGETRL